MIFQGSKARMKSTKAEYAIPGSVAFSLTSGDGRTICYHSNNDRVLDSPAHVGKHSFVCVNADTITSSHPGRDGVYRKDDVHGSDEEPDEIFLPAGGNSKQGQCEGCLGQAQSDLVKVIASGAYQMPMRRECQGQTEANPHELRDQCARDQDKDLIQC